MWLIDTTTLEMRDVNPEETQYAILSHTWEDEEVDFQEMRFQRDIAMKKKGFNKIAMTCQIAKQSGIPYAWVDTCCIDKTSSAALSEAINSMFSWYKGSSVCFAYLSDVHSEEVERNKDGHLVRFPNSRWFTRGWTLQELIAPRRVLFYDMIWTFLADKFLYKDKISELTGIDVDVLVNSDLLSTVPVGRRMSWASHRKTTRIEDSAYCLLGIFDINMPMLYGEGYKAFFRLQEEIASDVYDLSLFAWTGQGLELDDLAVASPDEYRFAREFYREKRLWDETRVPRGIRGIFARSPLEFAGCRTLRNYSRPGDINEQFSMSNRGLRIETGLYITSDDDYVVGLNCTLDPDEYGERELSICLTLTATGYLRRDAHKRITIDVSARWFALQSSYTLHIPREVSLNTTSDQFVNSGAPPLYFNFSLPPKYKISSVVARPHAHWDRCSWRFLSGVNVSTGYLEFSLEPKAGSFLVLCELDINNNRILAKILSDHGEYGDKAEMKTFKTLFSTGVRMHLSVLSEQWFKNFEEKMIPQLGGLTSLICGKKVASYYDRKIEYSVDIEERLDISPTVPLIYKGNDPSYADEINYSMHEPESGGTSAHPSKICIHVRLNEVPG